MSRRSSFLIVFQITWENSSQRVVYHDLKFSKTRQSQDHISTLRHLTPQLLLSAELVSRVHNAVEPYVKHKNKPLKFT